MLELSTKNIEVLGKKVTYAVDVEFEKDGETCEANVTCTYDEDANIGFPEWDCLIANDDELPDLTTEEENEIINYAKDKIINFVNN